MRDPAVICSDKRLLCTATLQLQQQPPVLRLVSSRLIWKCPIWSSIMELSCLVWYFVVQARQFHLYGLVFCGLVLYSRFWSSIAWSGVVLSCLILSSIGLCGLVLSCLVYSCVVLSDLV